ncbi:MAG: outer membrane lipoprotein carrier protein LolA [Flavobacteriaceae bacterium]|nr:outer membrane lipoprotein carrier protein LolA [Flavobacteriaceae bacterium]
MYKIKISFALLAVCFSILAFSQDKKAEQILKKVADKYKSFKSYKADFKYMLENKKDKLNISKKGTLYVKQSKFRLDIDGKEITCDNKTIWTYIKEANEVQINDYDPSNTDASPSRIFNIYEKGFISQFVEEKTEGGRVLQLIELTPIDKKKSYFKVKLFIEKMNNQILRTKIFDKNGNIYTYEISKFQAHIKIKENFFSFDKKAHPGLEVIDLR